jgi:hypothetical protein
VLAEWSKFDYVWLPAELEAEVTNRFLEVASVPLDDRLFVVSTDDAGKTQLKPVASQL